MKPPILTLVALAIVCLTSWALSQSSERRVMLGVGGQRAPAISTTLREPAITQTTHGDIGGTVTDSSGAVIPGVRVVLESPTGARREVVTSEDGSFSFANVPPGIKYRLRFIYSGFAVEQRWVDIDVGRRTQLDVVLDAGGPHPTPSVRPSPQGTPSPPPTPTPRPSPTTIPSPIPSPSATPRASPTASPGLSPTPTPTPANGQNPDWDALVSSEVQKLRDSKILFNPPVEMRQGSKERIEARISFADIGPAFTEGLEGRGAPQVESIKVGPIMKVVLVGDQDAFLIEKFSSEEQTVAGKPFAQWEWDVTPLRSGNQALHLQASASIYVPGRGEKPVDVPVIHKTIQVKVNGWYATKRFVASYWQWLLTTLIIPVGGWFWHLKRKKKPRTAGFV